MRQRRTVQTSLFDQFCSHEIGLELKAMSDWLDQQPDLVSLIAADLDSGAVKPTGRQGLPAEAVLRCALLKQYRQLSYEELAFHLEDSASFRAFARLPFGCNPKRSVLHKTIGRLRAETFEAINRTLLASADRAKVEDGKLVRIDSTVTAAAIHPPSDSSLLHDAVRVTVRLSKAARRLGARLPRRARDHRRAAKARLRVIEYTRSREKRRAAYRDLVKITRASLTYLEEAASALAGLATAAAERWRAEAAHMRRLIERVIEQTERRVFRGEAVPAADKVVSLFEPHADIIIKGGRDVAYGHKLNLTTGKSGLILDLVVEDGNPADSERLVPMLERHIAIYGKPPRQAATDGGYASRDNLAAAKALGVRDMAFHKRRGLAIEDMVKSRWVYRRLRNFRAGIEAGISCLKRGFGLARCTWRGLAHFKAYVWSAAVAYNLALLVRLLSPSGKRLAPT